MESTYKNCQSCGMPMSRDAEGGWFFTRKVPKLARWSGGGAAVRP